MRISDWSSDVCSSDLIVDPPIVSVNVSRRRAHAEDAARREDRLDLETLDSGVAGVLEGGTDAALDLDLDALVVRVECRSIDLQHSIEKLRLEADLERVGFLRIEARRLLVRRLGRIRRDRRDRKSVVEGQRVSVGVDLGGGR